MKYEFTREQLVRLLEMAAWEAAGTVWGTEHIATEVLSRYDGEGPVGEVYRAYVMENGDHPGDVL
jgi:hypothetical protein